MTSDASKVMVSDTDVPADRAIEHAPTSFNGKLDSFHYQSTSSDTKGTKTIENPHETKSPKSPLTSRVLRPRHSPRIAKDGSISKPSPSPSPHRKSTSASASPRRRHSGYAPPERYAHLQPLVDKIIPNLICVFIGVNPGIKTASMGHAYAHPSNLFWKLLHSSGCTPRLCKPEEDVELPRLFELGNTNIVSRPTRDASELSKQEMADGTPILEEKVRRFRPESVCLVGKGIWEAVWRYRYGRNPRKDEFSYGWQDAKENLGKTGDWEGARTFVSCSTSGLAASMSRAEKEAIWRSLGDFVKQRREERQAARETLKPK